MKVIIKNQTSGILSYVSGAVSIAANDQTTVTPDYWVSLFQDLTLYSDFQAGNIILNDGASDYTSGYSLSVFQEVTKRLIFEPLATVPFYYSAPIAIRQSAATSSGATVWAMRNPVASAKVVFVEQIQLLLSFDAGTPLGRSFQKYDLVRFDTSVPTGGTAITAAAADSAAGASAVLNIRYLDTGLTTTGISFGNVFATVGIPASDGATNSYIRKGYPFRLAAGEGLAIRLNGAAVIGQDLAGEIIWSER